LNPISDTCARLKITKNQKRGITAVVIPLFAILKSHFN